jgi:hypothetical protein
MSAQHTVALAAAIMAMANFFTAISGIPVASFLAGLAPNVFAPIGC